MLNYCAKFSIAISKYPKVASVNTCLLYGNQLFPDDFFPKGYGKNIKFLLHRQSERARMCF